MTIASYPFTRADDWLRRVSPDSRRMYPVPGDLVRHDLSWVEDPRSLGEGSKREFMALGFVTCVDRDSNTVWVLWTYGDVYNSGGWEQDEEG